MKFLVLAGLTLPVLLCAQVNDPRELIANSSKYLPESIFIKLNRNEFKAGDTAFFKAFVFHKFRLSSISTNLYVEFIDKQKTPVYAGMFPIVKGMCYGAIPIAKGQREDVYYLLVYTGWNLNFSEATQFISPVVIYNDSSASHIVRSKGTGTLAVKPEGGNFVSGVNCNAVVRLFADEPLPGKLGGFVYANDDAAHAIAAVKMVSGETGVCSFTPLLGKQYYVLLTDEQQRRYQADFPAVMPGGATLHVENLKSEFKCSLSSKGIRDILLGYTLVETSQGAFVYSARVVLARDEVVFSVPLDSSVRGLVQFTLLDPSGKVAAERLCFQESPDLSSLSRIIKNTNAVPGLASAEFFSAANASTPSLTATLADTALLSDSGLNSLSNTYWLQQLARPSYHTNQYFRAGNEHAAAALDVLLMSEQSRQFNWNTLVSNPRQQIKFLPDDYLTYEGLVTKGDKPLANEELTVLFQLPDSSHFVRQVKTDQQGRFVLKNLNFRGTARVYTAIRGLQETEFVTSLVLKRNTVRYTGELPETPYYLAARAVKDTSRRAAAGPREQLQDVIVQGRQKTPKEILNKQLSTPMFTEPSEIVFDFVNEDQDLGASLLLDWLRSRYSAINEFREFRGQELKVFIDEFPASFGQANELPVSSIAMVKILRNAQLTGSSSAVAIYLKNASMYKNEVVKKLAAFISVQGYF